MKTIRSRVAFAALAGALSIGSVAYAQQTQQASGGVEKSVRAFLSSTEKEITQAVRAGDGEALMSWVQRHVADNAQMTATVELYRGDTRKLLATVSADKDDLLSLQHSPMGAMPGMLAKSLRDYSLTIDVRSIEPIGDEAAVVATRITEKGALDMSAAMSAPGKPSKNGKNAAGDEAPTGSTALQPGAARASKDTGAQTTSFEGTAMCQHLIRLGASGEQPRISMTTCQGRMNL